MENHKHTQTHRRKICSLGTVTKAPGRSSASRFQAPDSGDSPAKQQRPHNFASINTTRFVSIKFASLQFTEWLETIKWLMRAGPTQNSPGNSYQLCFFPLIHMF